MWASRGAIGRRCPLIWTLASLIICLTRTSTTTTTTTKLNLIKSTNGTVGNETIWLRASVRVSGGKQANLSETGSSSSSLKLGETFKKSLARADFDEIQGQESGPQHHEHLPENHLAPAGAPNDPHRAGERQLQLLAQLERPVQQLVAQDVSLYETIKSETNGSRDGEQVSPVCQLDRDFLSLFDELWKIKNNSVSALMRLDYFSRGGGGGAAASDNQQQAADQNQSQLGGSKNFAASNNAVTFSRNRSSLQAKTNLKNGLAQAGSRINSWLALAQQRLQSAWIGFCDQMLQKLPSGQLLNRQRLAQGQPAKRTDIFDNPDKPNRAEDADASPNNTRVLSKRSPEVEGQLQAESAPCVVLTSEQRDKCNTQEQQISATLNNSFPGTMKSVEDNCKLITSLFTSCWPQNLRELRNSLSSWNETLLLQADFQLPPYFLDQRASASSGSSGGSSGGATIPCGIAPRMPQYLLDRINWMWLNLCVDKKFRQGYVDNLKCLSTWSQDRAQQVCTNEYRRMQTYLVSQAETGNAIGANFEWARGGNNQRTRQAAPQASESPSAGLKMTTEKPNLQMGADEEMFSSAESVLAGNVSTRDVSTAAATRMGLSESELTDREVSSKMLCCMFDQFLRCVHKQAIRDCGRPGAQFVVNFMSRIGTDDMKFLCNSETKSVHRTRPSGRRTGSHESRSPFIDGQYCSDPRIQTGLANQIERGNPMGSSGTGPSSGSRPSSSRSKSKDKMNINHDPTFFGSENIVQSTAWPSRFLGRSLLIIILLHAAFVLKNLLT